MLIFTLVLMLNSKKMTQWATDKYYEAKKENPDMSDSLDDYITQMNDNIHNVCYALLIFTGVIALTVLFGYCYRESTMDKTFERREKLMAQKDIDKSQQAIDTAIQKNLEKRAYYEQKYPDL